MAAGQTTGTYTFGSGLFASDMVLEVFERIGWRSASLTIDMLLSAQRSFNFVQARWSNLGVNLWEVTLRQFIMTEGVATYTLPANTISVLPAAFVRNYPLTVDTDLTPALTTVAGNTTVTITQSNSGQGIGAIINISTPVTVGGIVLYGYYAVTTTPTSTTYTIESDTAAASSTSGGTLPVFTADGTTSNVVVTLANSPFLVGQDFIVQVPVTVGGLTLEGSYPIISAGSGSFTIDVTSATTVANSATMNSGDMQIQTASPNTIPVDRVLYPLGRNDYTSLAVKNQEASPTSFWFDRMTIPQITFWPVADGNGPYQFNYYALTQMQDASVQGGAVLDIPYRFMEAYAAACAAHLAMKWRPDIAPALMAYADKVWIEASDADREEVSFYVGGDLSGYFN